MYASSTCSCSSICIDIRRYLNVLTRHIMDATMPQYLKPKGPVEFSVNTSNKKKLCSRSVYQARVLVTVYIISTYKHLIYIYM